MRLDDPNLELADLLSSPLRDDETGISIASAVTPAMRSFLGSIRNIALLPNVRGLPEPVLDELARELNVPWYDFGASVSVKRRLIQSSDATNRRLGTPWAIETIAAAYFGSARVQEWFEYGAEPYHFQVLTGNLNAVNIHYALFHELIVRTKNARSVFDGVIVDLTTPSHVAWIGWFVQAVTTVTIPMKEVSA